MNYDSMREWLRKKRDIVIAWLIICGLLLSIVIGLRMQRYYEIGKHAEEQPREQEKVRLASQPQASVGNKKTSRKPSASFFLKPSPEEVLSLIKEAGDAELPASNQKYTGLRVMWPAYFFQILHQESNRATVLLDVAEDGFGVTIETEIDSLLFPEILVTERGTKIWIAGEIRGVDASGTGTIHMATEEVRFQDGLMEAIRGVARKNVPKQLQQATPTPEPTKAEEETR